MKKRDHVALTKCFFCNEANEILLATKYTHDGEPLRDLAPLNGKVVNMHPCPKCEGYMKLGVIVITIDDAKSTPNWHKPDGSKNWMPNPYRTGGWFVVKDEAIKRLDLNDPRIAEFALSQRYLFIEHEAAEKLGFFQQAAPEVNRG